MLITHAAVVRREHTPALGAVRSAVFASGYLLVLAAFALAATVVQWRLSEARLLPSGQLGRRCDCVAQRMADPLVGRPRLRALGGSLVSPPSRRTGWWWRSGAWPARTPRRGSW